MDSEISQDSSKLFIGSESFGSHPPQTLTTTPNPKATHVCDQCSRAFSRAEHLERHHSTHLPSTASKSFFCTFCNKGFTRKDVLTRHVRAVHETKKSDVRKSRRKSCRRCAAFKIKCTGGGKGKESGERAEEPCEACRKREVECIFDFGIVEKVDAVDDAAEFGSDDAHSEGDTASSEYSVKRRKTEHNIPRAASPVTFAPPSVSPHLLSAARLASDRRTQAEMTQPPPGMPDFNLYFSPLRHNTELPTITSVRIAEEDLNAANTLQGINPTPVINPIPHMSLSMDSWKNGIVDAGMGVQANSDYQEFQPLFNGTATPGDRLDDPDGMVEIHEEDNYYFNFGIFDHSTDWLRDWGPNDSISPESHGNGIDLGEGIPFTLGNDLTPISGPPPKPPQQIQPPLPPPPPSPPSPPPPPPPPSQHLFPENLYIKLEDTSVPGLPTVSPIRDNASNGDFLPWGWRSKNEPSRKIMLPPLRQAFPSDHTAYSTSAKAEKSGAVTDRMRMEIIHLLALPSARPPYPGCDKTDIEKMFPNKEVISVFVSLYFEQFHPILPVIHRPSFSIDRCPSILLIAMASIGASYSNLKNAKTFADGLSELCKRSLGWMAENNPAYAKSAFYLQSLCLQNLYAMGSGSTSLYDAADVSRSVIIGNSRRIGLFSGVLTPSSSSPSSAPNSPTLRPSYANSQELDIRWRDWREKEGLKRLAWGIFEYDSSFSTLSNRRGAITLSDISIRIPCSELLWEASSASSWNALLAQEPEVLGLPFYGTLKGVISGRFDVKNLTSWGKRLCAQAMGRIMWDFKELEESVLSVAAFGNASFKPQKEMLLRALMRVCESAMPRAGEAEGDRYHWILARLVAHYAHLHAAFPTISLMLNLARKPPQQNFDSEPRVKRLKNIFSTDPISARTLAWHAAQIIALSRWKPVFSPVEGMRLFLAGVVLWGFGNYYRPRDSSATSTIYPGPQEEEVRLDILPWNMSTDGMGATNPDNWIRCGRGKATIEVGGEEAGEKTTGVCGGDGAKQVLRVVVGILGSLRVWGLGGEFKGVLEELMARKT